MAGRIQVPASAPGPGRPLQTHMVAMGRLRISAYEDTLPNGEGILRAIHDGAIVARRRGDGTWNRPVAERRERPQVKPLGPAVTVELTKGKYY